jgi:hypothetical protein
LIVALVGVLVLALSIGAAGVWWLFADQDPRLEAAEDLTLAFAASEGETGLVDWCDGLFGYGSDMVFEDRESCLDTYTDWFGALSTSDRDRFAAVIVDDSSLTTIDEETLALRQSDLDRPDGDWSTYDDQDARELIFVIQPVGDQDGWRIVGVATEDFSIGTVPDEAGELVTESEDGMGAN